MPLFYQHNINDFTKLGVWKIEEGEDFFLTRVPLSRAVTHPHKRLQHLAGRYLLPFLFEDFPLSEILIADTRKPFLENEAYHFSISHCGDYVAAIASSVERAGVDVELITPKIKGIERKFLHADEIQLIREWKDLAYSELQLLTILWSAKESIFKWYGLGKVDFREHIRLKDHTIAPDHLRLFFSFSREVPIILEVRVLVFGGLVLAWLNT